jgi:hypothetical protein
MSLEQLAYLAQIIGTVFVVASLVYVARQLNQNTEILKSQSRQALLTNDKVAIQIAIEGRDLYELLAKPDPLSFQDQFRLSMMLIMSLRDREYEFFQYRAGAVDEAAWLSYREIARLMLDSERKRRWWNKIGKNFFDPEFVAMIEEINLKAPLDDTFTQFGTWE